MLVQESQLLSIIYINELFPKNLLQRLIGFHLDLNIALVNREKIYDWIVECIIERIRATNHEIDFDDIEFVKQLFSKELKIKKSLLSILGEGTHEYNKELFNILKELLSDKIKYLKNLIQYLFVSRNKLLIIVLDNCDKRNRDEQLLMFEVASWLKGNFNVMVFLPLRETTYDLYKRSPSYTVIKDLVFRIDLRLLINVIRKED